MSSNTAFIQASKSYKKSGFIRRILHLITNTIWDIWYYFESLDIVLTTLKWHISETGEQWNHDVLCRTKILFLYMTTLFHGLGQHEAAHSVESISTIILCNFSKNCKQKSMFIAKTNNCVTCCVRITNTVLSEAHIFKVTTSLKELIYADSKLYIDKCREPGRNNISILYKTKSIIHTWFWIDVRPLTMPSPASP